MKISKIVLCTNLILGFGISDNSDALTKNSREKFMQAVKDGNIKSAKRNLVFWKNKKLNSEYFDKSPLETAIDQNNVEMVELLLNKGANPNISGRTSHALPIIRAIEENNLQIVRLLVNHGADLNISYYGKVPLERAIVGDNTEIIQFLLNNGADPNWKNDTASENAFMYAVKKGTPEIVSQLIDKGARVNEVDKYGETVLVKAIRADHLDIMTLLIERGANVNEKSTKYVHEDLQYKRFPIEYAVETGMRDIIECLINNGANVPNYVLRSALAYCDIDTLKYLQSKGAKLLDKDGFDREGDAYIAIDNVIHQKSTELLKFVCEQLKNEGIDLKECINQKNRHRDSLILTAVKLEFSEGVKFLLNEGADERAINGGDSYNNTALIYAIKNKNSEIANLLIDHGADVNQGYSQNPLLVAVKNNDIEMVRKLLEHGANETINKWYSEGNPLMIAIQLNNTEMVELLLNNGANSNYSGRGGTYDSTETALTMAVQCGNYDVVKLLLEHGAKESINTSNEHWVRVSENVYAKKQLRKKTPLQIARKGGLSNIVELLVQHGAK